MLRKLPAAILLGHVLLSAATVHALINPHFTPVHLVEQAALIVEVDLKQAQNKDQYQAAVRTVLKGKTDLKVLRFDLSKAINVQNADALRELAAAAKGPVLFFVGEFSEGDSSKSADQPVRRGYLHLLGQWAECRGGEGGAWSFSQIDAPMQGVWAGGTDMLRRAVDYILEDDDPEVPVADGAAWVEEPVKVCQIEGRIRAVKPVDLGGNGKLLLFVACDRGDRLLAWDAKAKQFTDLTAGRQLASRSAAFAWGDFNGDGHLDLASYDGTALVLHAQQADGTFRSQPLGPSAALEHGCSGLAALDIGPDRPCGLLVSTNAFPVLVAFDAAGKPTATTFGGNQADLPQLGQSGACLVADFDGDALPDVLQPGSEASLLYAGRSAGQFAPGAACAVRLGKSPSSACLADLDGDGRPDVFCVAADTARIWQNEGTGKFHEYLGLSGEIAYIAKPGGVDCASGDVNNDGRQDVLIAYAGMGPQLFFNRGYRSFGHAHTLDLAERRLLLVAEQGQQAACLGDFDGDGAQDMALALGNGELWVFFRENDDHSALSATVALPAAGGYRGPLTVTGLNGKRCLGAWSVTPGGSAAFFGRREPGPITVKWQLPGKPLQQRELIVETRPVRFEIK